MQIFQGCFPLKEWEKDQERSCEGRFYRSDSDELTGDPPDSMLLTRSIDYRINFPDACLVYIPVPVDQETHFILWISNAKKKLSG
jgi:hypothetical protein